MDSAIEAIVKQFLNFSTPTSTWQLYVESGQIEYNCSAIVESGTGRIREGRVARIQDSDMDGEGRREEYATDRYSWWK